MIKNLLIDLGGVLIDADLELAMSRFKSLGMENISEYLNLYRQNGLFLGVEDGSLDRAAFNDAFRKAVGRDTVTDEQIDAAWLSIVKGVNVEKLRWMTSHRSVYKFYLLSNINPYVFEWAQTDRFSKLGKPIGEYFDKMFASYKIGMTKPSEEIFKYVMRNAPLLPEETLFIDDGDRNVLMASSLGFHVYQPYNGENWIEPVEKILAENNR